MSRLKSRGATASASATRVAGRPGSRVPERSVRSTPARETAGRGAVDISWPSADPEGLARELWGGSPTIAERQEAAERQLARQFEMRREVIADSITVDAATRILGVSEQAIRASLMRGDLLGIKDGKQWRLPVWQFDADCPRGFVPGIARVADAFHGRTVRLSAWMTCENVDLGSRTPAQALAAGEVADVVDLAAAATAAAW